MPFGRKPGGQRGNRNAEKHGFYGGAMQPEGRKILRRALAISPQDLQDEIGLLRARLYQLVEISPKNVELLALVSRAFVRMVAVHYGMNKEQQQEVHDSLRDLIRDLSPPPPEGATT